MSDEKSYNYEIPPHKLRFISSNKIYFVFDNVWDDIQAQMSIQAIYKSKLYRTHSNSIE
ncbi:hypothetical protein GCM10022396_38640 [Flavivirga amylovorans]